jgi:hypothetical protein
MLATSMKRYAMMLIEEINSKKDKVLTTKDFE